MNREEKFEIRNSKFETNSKHEIPMLQTLALVEVPVLNFGFWSLGFVSDFVLRISKLVSGEFA